MLVILLFGGCAAQDDESIIVLKQSQFMLEADLDGVRNTETIWKDIQLPDTWNASRPDVGGIGVYRFHLDFAEKPEELWAILLPRVGHNAAVYFNGTLLGIHGNFKKYSNIWNTPFIITLPSSLIENSNTIDIKVQAFPNFFGRLLPPRVGPEEKLKSVYQDIYFAQVTFSQVCAVFALTMGVSLLLIWWYRRESLYGWFALGGISWAFYSLYFFVGQLPVALAYWIVFCFANSFVMLSAMLIFICFFMGWKYQRGANAIFTFALVAGVMLLLLPDAQVFVGVKYVMGIYAMMYAVLGVALINALRFEKSKRQALTSLVGIGINIGLGLHDWANITFMLNHPYLLQFGQPLIFLVMGRYLLKDYMTALHASEISNAKLDERVHLREQELKIVLQENQLAEQEKMLLKERERIMADIHDGVGGHLVSALSVAEATPSASGELVSQIIHQALDELRIVIDSLDPDERKLSQMLAAFKHRYNQRLESRGIETQWIFEQLDQVGPEKSLQLLRILQELMTNIIKHAQADAVTVQVRTHTNANGKTCELLVLDNGIGFDVNLRIGRGLGNLMRRAAVIGGTVTFTPQPRGTKVVLVFPLTD